MKNIDEVNVDVKGVLNLIEPFNMHSEKFGQTQTRLNHCHVLFRPQKKITTILPLHTYFPSLTHSYILFEKTCGYIFIMKSSYDLRAFHPDHSSIAKEKHF